jgi:DNA-binding NarL/FixJ family response regulator
MQMELQIKILVIDTDPNWIEFVRQTLGDVVVNDPTAPVDMALVSDQKLCAPDCRFVVTTTAPTPQGEIEAYRLGASDYVVKSFEVDKLKEIIG